MILGRRPIGGIRNVDNKPQVGSAVKASSSSMVPRCRVHIANSLRSMLVWQSIAVGHQHEVSANSITLDLAAPWLSL